MFVYPPPPPRYAPTTSFAPGGASNGTAIGIIETTNIVKHPEGGCPLQVGEGTYELRDDLQLATPPPHPSEAPVLNPNPLSTGVLPATSGVKISLVVVQPRRNQLQPFRLKSTGISDLRSIKEAEEEARNSSEHGGSNFDTNATPVFGEWNAALAPAPTKDGPGVKRRKPKGNIVKSSSSFVSRVIVNEATTKKLGERSPDGLYVFANINRAFQWLDYDGKAKHDPIAKVLFTKAHVLAHDVNEVTKSTTHLDVIMGTSAADMIWYEPMQQKYARINKNGVINSAPIKHIKWIPGSENLFMVAHADGSLVIYDKEKEDATFTPEESEDDAETNAAETRQKSPFKLLKSVNSKNQKANPVA